MQVVLSQCLCWLQVGDFVWFYHQWCCLEVVLRGIVHVALMEHMGCSCSVLNCRPILDLLGYLQSDIPILRCSSLFYPISNVPGVLVPIIGSTISPVPSVSSQRLDLNLLYRTTTRPASWVALILPLLPVPGCRSNEWFGVVNLSWGTSLAVP